MSVDLEIQLNKAHQELAALKAEYDEFVYIISHDLSAPLRQVEGFAEIIVAKHADSFDDKTKRHFELIQGGSNQAKLILEAMRSYSRLNTMAQPFTLFDLNKLVHDVKCKLSTLFNDAGATIVISHLPTIVGEEKQISQVFECLLHNALSYRSPERECQISIDVEDQKHYWQFYVTDNGIGIAENIQEKIFKVLRRGVSDKKSLGIGMGLAIVKKVLRHHQGRIWLKSEKDRGSSFYFTIPKDLANE